VQLGPEINGLIVVNHPDGCLAACNFSRSRVIDDKGIGSRSIFPARFVEYSVEGDFFRDPLTFQGFLRRRLFRSKAEKSRNKD